MKNMLKKLVVVPAILLSMGLAAKKAMAADASMNGTPAAVGMISVDCGSEEPFLDGVFAVTIPFQNMGACLSAMNRVGKNAKSKGIKCNNTYRCIDTNDGRVAVKRPQDPYLIDLKP